MIEKEMMRDPTEQEKEMIRSLKLYADTESQQSLISALFALMFVMVFPLTSIGKDLAEVYYFIMVIWFICFVGAGACFVCVLKNYRKTLNVAKEDAQSENYDGWRVIDCVADNTTIGGYRSDVVSVIKESNGRKFSFMAANNVIEKLFKNKEFVLFVKDDVMHGVIGVAGDVEVIDDFEFEKE